MKRKYMVAGLALTALIPAAAFADSLSIGFGVGGPAPVYEAPAPVYYQPAPVYQAPAPVYEAPAPVYGYGPYWNPYWHHHYYHHYWHGGGWYGY